jgi:hypothetical protein
MTQRQPISVPFYFEGLWIGTRFTLASQGSKAAIGHALKELVGSKLRERLLFISVVVFSASIRDVSHTVQVTQKTPLGRNYAFVSGAHSMTNASRSYDMVIDLSYMNKTQIILAFTTLNRSILSLRAKEEVTGFKSWRK